MANENEPAAAPAPDGATADDSTPAAGNAIDRIVEAAAEENAKAGKSIADEKIERIVEESAAETERGRAARRQP
jgi:hypothetical protein